MNEIESWRKAYYKNLLQQRKSSISRKKKKKCCINHSLRFNQNFNQFDFVFSFWILFLFGFHSVCSISDLKLNLKCSHVHSMHSIASKCRWMQQNLLIYCKGQHSCQWQIYVLSSLWRVCVRSSFMFHQFRIWCAVLVAI